MEAAIPCYFHPATDPAGWEWLRTSNVSFAVVNPHSGELRDAGQDFIVANAGRSATHDWGTPSALPHPYGWHASLSINC